MPDISVPSEDYSDQKSARRKLVLVGIITVAFVVLIIILFFQLFIQSNSSPVPSVEIKKASPSANQSTPSASDTSSAGKIETTDWKTYKNGTYGFEFKYPIKWVVANEVCPNNSSKDLIILHQGKETDCTPLVVGLEGIYTFAISISSQKFDLNKKIKGREGFVATGDFITVGGVKAARVYPVSQAFYGRIEIFVNSKSNGLMIVFPHKDLEGNYDPNYDIMLSTFKFLY